jgi:sugar phosphate isomerase/epimerase
MKLAGADFTWPLLAHPDVLALIKLLGLDGVDLGLMGNRSHIRPEQVRGAIPFWAGMLRERLDRAGLALADVFVIPWSDYATLAPNTPDRAQLAESATLFREMLEFASLLGAGGMTIVPGVRFDDEPYETSLRRSAETLKRRVEEAAVRGIALSVEGHLDSNADTPERLGRLLELTPGLQLTLDYGHFVYQGIAESEIEPLLPFARHVHCRGGAPGKLQTTVAENTIDFRRMVDHLAARGYEGYLALEYVWVDWQGCNRTENVCETILLRDLLREALSGASTPSRR